MAAANTVEIVLKADARHLIQALKRAGHDVRDFGRETDTQADRVRKAWDSLGTRSLRDIRTEIDRVKDAYRELERSGTASAEDLNRAWRAAQRRMAELEGESRQGASAVERHWAAAAAAVAAMGLAAKESVETFAAFDDTMRQVGAVSGAGAEQLEALRAKAAEMGATTRFSAQEAADALLMMGRAGFQASTQLESLETVLALASATATDLGQTSDIVTNIMSGFGIEARELGGAADVLTAAVNSSNSTLTELGTAFSYVGPVAKSVGMSFEETVAILAKLHSAGIKGSMAGTTLRGMIARLLLPTSKASKVLDELGMEMGDTRDIMEDLGVSVYDSSGNFRPMLDILEEMDRKAASTGDLLQIAGVRAGPGMAALMQQGIGAIQEYERSLHDVGGTTRRIAGEMEAGLGGALRSLRSALESVKIQIGEDLEPAVKAVVVPLTDLMRGFAALDDRTRYTVEGLAALGTAFVGVKLGMMAVRPLLTTIMTTSAATATAIRGLSRAFVLVGAVLGAVDLVRLAKAMWETRDAAEGLRETYSKYGDAAREFESFKDVQTEGLADLRKKSKEELSAQADEIQKAIQYYSNMRTALTAKSQEGLTLFPWIKTSEARDAAMELETVERKYYALQGALGDVARAARESGVDIGTGARNAAQELDAAYGKLSDSIDGAVQSFDEEMEAVEELNGARLREIDAMLEGAAQERAVLDQRRSNYMNLSSKVRQFYDEQTQALDEYLSDLDEQREAEGVTAATIARLQEQVLRKKIEVAARSKEAILSALEEATAKEREYAREVERLQGLISSARGGLEDELRALRRSRMSEEEALLDKRREAEEKLHAARKALEEGNFETAQRLSQESKRLYADVARASEKGFKGAYEGAKNAGEVYIQSLEDQKGEAEAKWDEQQEQVDLLRETLDELNKGFAEFVATLDGMPESRKAEIVVEAPGMGDVKAAYDSLRDKTVTVTIRQRVVETHSTGGLAGVRALRRGGRLPGYGGGDRVRALLEPGEYVIRKEAVRRYFPIIEAINSLRLPSSAGSWKAAAEAGRTRYRDGGPVGDAGRSVTLNLAVGGETYPTETDEATAQRLERKLRRERRVTLE